MLKTFKPTLIFLLKFGVIFALGSLTYSFFVKSYETAEPPTVDPITRLVAHQTKSLDRIFGFDAHIWEADNAATIMVYIIGYEDDNITFYEGCNGINIMILFVAFVFAFGSNSRAKLWFIPAGLLAIHLFNLLRLSSLSVMATVSESAFHFFHKFAFTGVIYAFVLLLWYLWATKFYKTETNAQ